MNHDHPNAPAARTWRDIPQPVKTRAMSRGGKWRLASTFLRAAALMAFIAAVGGGVWTVYDALDQTPKRLPVAAKTMPMKAAELVTDGVLEATWLSRTLKLPEGTTLLELDLDKLRTRLLSEPQVLTANLTRQFPDRLRVELTERSPVARAKVEWGGVQQTLLVARDGVTFVGEGFEPSMLQTLPWLHGASIKRRPEGLVVEGMEVVSELLGRARFEADHLYRTWHVVSLARLASDREIEVRTTRNVTAVFNAQSDFFRQLAHLDYLWERLAQAADAQGRVRIDLSLGREVPVLIQPLSPAPSTRHAGVASPAPSPAGPAPLHFHFSPSAPKIKREL